MSDPAATRPALLALDTAGLYFRAFHSVPEKITDPAGHPANAIRGFCDMLATLITEYRPAGIVAAEDANWRPAWRVALLPEYKSQRVGADGGEDAPASLGPQVETIWKLLTAFGVSRAWLDDGEADDVLAALPADGLSEAGQTVIVTGDRDLFQLARPDRKILYIGAGMAKRALYGPDEVARRVGLPAGTPATAYADCAVFVGDPSDGLPGVPAVGPAGAAKLVAAHGDVEGVIAAAEDEGVKIPPKQRASILAHADYMRAAKQVIALGTREELARPQVAGNLDGSLGPVDVEAVTAIAAATGQARAIGRLDSALELIRG